MHITLASMTADGSISNSVLEHARIATTVVTQTDISETLRREGINYETLDPIFDSSNNFDELTDRSCEILMRDGLLFIALGDICHNNIAAALAQRVTALGGRITVLSDTAPALRIAFEHGLLSGNNGIHSYTASSFQRACDTDAVLVVNEIDTKLIASELKLNLARFYGDEHPILLVNTRNNSADRAPLCRLDSLDTYGYYISAVIPPLALVDKSRYTFSDLISIMRILRSKDGCPWDREQTHNSLKRYLVEESYEVLEAIVRRAGRCLASSCLPCAYCAAARRV
jgi:tetrapyrrole methylase family protein/MazG family protein